MAVALRTPRLLLREWREEDREPFMAMCSDPEVMRYFYRPPADRAACDAWIDRMRLHNTEHGFAYWAVELPGKADLIGAIGLTRVFSRAFPFAPAIEIGWRLAPHHWGQGFATEAARAVLDDGFGRLDLAEIVAFTLPVNRRSQAVMLRLGMTRDPADDFDHPGVPEGQEMRRHVLYRLRR
jgi:ribosomal-protein-alanine N-acetyltransferase